MARLPWLRICVTGSIMCSPCSLPLTLSSSTNPLAACRRVKTQMCTHFCKASWFSRTSNSNQTNFFCLPYCFLLHSATHCLSVRTFYLPTGIDLPLKSIFICPCVKDFPSLSVNGSFCILLPSLHFEGAFLVFTVFRRLSCGSFKLKYLKYLVYFR